MAVLLLRALIDAGERAGVDPKRALDALGLPPDVMDDIAGWIPVEAMARAWMLVPEMSGDPDFGLHAGETVTSGAYGVLEFAAISSMTAFEALERVARFYRTIGAMSEISFTTEGSRVRIAFRQAIVADPERLRHYNEHIFSMLATRARELARGDLAPLEVRFAHRTPDRTSEHARIFRAPIAFGQPCAELVMDRAALEAPLRTANPKLSSVLEETGVSVHAREDDVVERVRRALPTALRAGDVRLSEVARAIGIGTRTLQRRLGERSVTYAHLVDEARRALAIRHVEEAKMSFGEIAFALGFSQPSAFHRAFKRWTGDTPAHRRAARGGRGQ